MGLSVMETSVHGVTIVTAHLTPFSWVFRCGSQVLSLHGAGFLKALCSIYMSSVPFGDYFLSVRLGARALELAKSGFKSQLCYPPQLLICEMGVMVALGGFCRIK